jgi:serine/threonine protein kinase
MHDAAILQSGQGNERATAGRTLGGWTLIERLGAGPVCESWIATRGVGAERAVVRVLSAPFASDERARLEWVRASWAANRFHHRRVVKVIEQLTGARGEPVIVRGFTRGESLESAVRRGAVDGAIALRLGEQLLDALEMAHAHGILHGALTPTNVMVTPRGSVRVVDFATTPGLRSPRTGAFGVLAPARCGPYVAPECRAATAEAVPPPNEQTDVWSVGACLHFALTGRPPDVDGQPRLSLAGSSEDVCAVIALALARNPADRYESAYAMLGDVRRLLAGRRPKLDGAHAPVPSQSFAPTASLPPPPPVPVPVPASSSGLRGIGPGAPAPGGDAGAGTAAGEWRGNVLLLLAIALLVGLATFVLVRERLTDARTAPSSAETR